MKVENEIVGKIFSLGWGFCYF